MSTLHSIYLGIIQGIAEFLPISSSGHLAIAQNLFGLEEVPLLFDIFLHLATLLAVCIVFWKKIWELLKCFGRWITKRPRPETNESVNNEILTGTEKAGRRTIIAIIVSTIITGVIGIVTSKLIPDLSVKFVCAGFLVTAALLIISGIIEKKNAAKIENPVQEGVSLKQSIVIGLMQGLGTLPGISRSGSTISGALFSKLDRKAAGDYSFIISIPAILGAFVLDLKDLGEVSSTIGMPQVLAGCIAAFITGFISLKLLMKIIRKGKLAWFSAYLIPAGILGLIFL
ncbi:MAG: undecaprenyl-diphosphate phosphatase [Treponema sp.]|nr:undecaprenyl-diphosphate phosphatase [Treponema sp.]